MDKVGLPAFSSSASHWLWVIFLILQSEQFDQVGWGEFRERDDVESVDAAADVQFASVHVGPYRNVQCR